MKMSQKPKGICNGYCEAIQGKEEKLMATIK
jgi:hypothetical protein